MPQAVQCAHCHQCFSAADHLAGKTVRCASCRKPLEVPPLPNLADLLDDEPAQPIAVEEPVQAAYVDPNAPICVRCKNEMIPGERYCVSCGFHNFDAAESVAKAKVQKLTDEARAEERARRQALLANPGLGGLLNFWADK